MTGRILLLIGALCGACATPHRPERVSTGPQVADPAPVPGGTGLAAGPNAPSTPEPPTSRAAADAPSAVSANGAFTLRWQPLGGDVPKNEPFELEFWLEREGAPFPGALVVVRGWMPDHGHGMLRRPEVEDRGDGSYHVRGMLFHMGGFWELFFDVYEPDKRKDRIRFELNL